MNELGKTANECIVQILESYMEFVNIMEKTLAKCDVPKPVKPLAKMLIAQRKNTWAPILEDAKKRLTTQK